MTEKEIAEKLFIDLKNGRMTKIGIEEIEEAVKAYGPTMPKWAYGPFVENVTRHVVEIAARAPE